MRGRFAMVTTVILASVNLAWGLQAALTSQAVPASPDWTATIEHLTLNGALIVAVITLWKQLGKKDDMLVASVKNVTESLSATAAANMELRTIITESVQAKVALASAIDRLQVSIGELPCTVGVHRGKGLE